MFNAAMAGFMALTGAIFVSVETPIAPVEKFMMIGQASTGSVAGFSDAALPFGNIPVGRFALDTVQVNNAGRPGKKSPGRKLFICTPKQ